MPVDYLSFQCSVAHVTTCARLYINYSKKESAAEFLNLNLLVCSHIMP